MGLRGVIFDMGGTLLHYSPPGQDWESMERLGAGCTTTCARWTTSCRQRKTRSAKRGRSRMILAVDQRRRCVAPQTWVSGQ